MMRVLIVDDEPLARSRLKRMLERIAAVEICGEAADGIEAREKIAALKPDLVLLDIHMPELDGLTLAATTLMPPIIFTTAFQEHALEAFELAAVDYLLKPIEQDRLEKAIQRAQKTRLDGASLRGLLEQALGRTETQRIAARSGSTVHFFDPREIGRLSSSDKYTLLTHQGAEYLLDDSLNTLEQKLAPFGFLRVHRSELVNLSAVKALHLDDGGAVLELKDGQKAQVSRRMLAQVKARLGLAP